MWNHTGPPVCLVAWSECFPCYKDVAGAGYQLLKKNDIFHPMTQYPWVALGGIGPAQGPHATKAGSPISPCSALRARNRYTFTLVMSRPVMSAISW